MRKRLLSLLLTFVMIIGVLPVQVFAVDDSITVYVTISDKGVLAADKNGEPMGYRAVSVADRDNDGKLTVSDALIAAHTEYSINGTEDYGISYGYASKLWGKTTSNLLAFVNNAGVSTSWDKKTISDGDSIVASINKDSLYYADWYTYFDAAVKEVRPETEFTLTLKGFQGMAGGTAEAVSGVSVGLWKDGAFSSVDDGVTDAAGQVRLSFADSGTYYVTASGTVRDEVTDYNSYPYETLEADCPIIAPVCVVTIPEEKTDAEYVADDRAALDITYADGQNLTLPNKGASNQTSITWCSSNSDIISNDGVFTRPDQDTDVTLTATITCGQVSDTKEFPFTVLGRLNAVKVALTSETLKPEEFTGKTEWAYTYDSVVKDVNILTLAQAVVDKIDSNVTVALHDAFVAGDVIGEDGAIKYPTTAAKEITVPFTLSANGNTAEHSVTITVPRHATTKVEAIEALKATLTWDKIKNKNISQNEVKTELKLPRGKSTGLQITWSITPSDTQALVIGTPSSSSWANTVTQPQNGQSDARLTLTATLGYAADATMIDAGPMPADGNAVSFDITIPALTNAEYEALMAEMETALDTASSKISIALGTSAGNTQATLDCVTENLYLNHLLKTTNGYQTLWTSTNAAIESPSNGTGVAAVTIPREGDAVSGQLQVKLSKFGYEKTKTFDVTVPVWSDEIAVDKQANVQKVADALNFADIRNKNTSDTDVTQKLALVTDAEQDGNKITFRTYNSSKAIYKITWQSSHPEIISNTGSITRPSESTQVTLTATISLKIPIEGVAAETKTIVVNVPKQHVPKTAASLEPLLDGTAATFAGTTNWEAFLAMAAYEDVRDSSAKLTETAKQNMLNSSLNAILAENSGETAFSKAILDMQSIGVDPRELYPVNRNTHVDAVNGLNEKTHSAAIWTAAYTLLAYQQGDYSIGTQETDLITALLATQLENGGWTSWEGAEADATGLAIQALAAYYDCNTEVKTALDKAVDYLSSVQLTNGGFGGMWGENANNSACVIMGLCALGIDPNEDSRFIKNAYSVLDALLAYAVEDNTGFALSIGDEQVNAYATQQGFPALIAAYQTIKTGQAYNVYDFSNNILAPGRATGSGSVTTPSVPSGDNITVKLTIKSDTGYWLNNKSVTIPGDDATVYHALMEALDGSGIVQTGAASGYVRSMTKDGRTLAEFTNGKNSGWMYKVNGELPDVGLTDCAIEDGDTIVWFYTNDWTSVPGASGGSWGKKEVSDLPFDDVAEDYWASEEIQWAYANGYISGKTETTFDPASSISRQQIWMILARHAGKNPADMAEAKAWALANGISDGTNPGNAVTRQQLVALLYRYAAANGCDVNKKADLSDYPDAVAVAGYAHDAMAWSVANGIVGGTTAGTLDPTGSATRAQFAAILYRFCEKMN